METHRWNRTLKNAIKKLIPTPFLRHLNSQRLYQNQRKILSASREHETIRVEPINQVEHYFHFVFDLALPLSCLLDAAPSGTTFSIRPFGIYTTYLQEMFSGNVEVEENEPSEIKKRTYPLLGMNPQLAHIKHETLSAFKNRIIRSCAIDPEEQNKVLLIERMPPDEYFKNTAVKKGAGASRRSIANHEELENAIRSMVQPPLHFHNLQLEYLPFREQVRLFDSAAVVIAQHGAGLANCTWMRPGSVVIELSHSCSLKHFQHLSRAMKHYHIIHRTEGSHTVVDIDSLASKLVSDNRLRALFKSSPKIGTGATA